MSKRNDYSWAMDGLSVIGTPLMMWALLACVMWLAGCGALDIQPVTMSTHARVQIGSNIAETSGTITGSPFAAIQLASSATSDTAATVGGRTHPETGNAINTGGMLGAAAIGAGAGGAMGGLPGAAVGAGAGALLADALTSDTTKGE